MVVIGSVLKLAFLLVLAYLAVQAGRNLYLAAAHDGRERLDAPRFEDEDEGPRRRATTPRPPRHLGDVEDARFRDVE